MEGRRFGALVVLRREGSTGRRPNGSGALVLWRCVCDCGGSVLVRGDRLRRGLKKACNVKGHSARSPLAAATRPERKCYDAMMQRCYNTLTPSYKGYGAKGVKVCARWRESFENFLVDMGPRPSPQHSIDRYPKMDGNYEPKNCRWATPKQQNRNKPCNIRVEFEGQTIAIADYAEKAGVRPPLIRRRLARGWSVEEALTTPADDRSSKSLEKWLRSLGQEHLLTPVAKLTTNS